MSTAGKVLICLIVLTSIIWIFVTAGVDQLNRNGNEVLTKLNDQIATANEQIQKLQRDITENKDRTGVQQEATDREITRLRARQSDVERARSEMAEILLQVQLELGNLQHTAQNAKVAQDRRLAERETEEKAIAALNADLVTLKATNTKQLARISELREKFRTTYRASLDMVSRTK